jgi:ADP-heptose:LPS heptosyltransferase
MAEAFHQPSFRHRARRSLLYAISRLPRSLSPRASHNRILLIRPDHLGDVLLTTPAIRALKQARPYSELHALVGPWSAQVLLPYDEIDQVLTLPFPAFDRQPSQGLTAPYKQAVTAARSLHRIGYGSAIIARPDHWWGALLAHLAGIPRIFGYDLPDVAPFLTDSIRFSDTHAVIQNLRLVEHWTGPLNPAQVRLTFPVQATDRAYIDSYLETWGITANQKLLCIHPGSGAEVKLWEEQKWATVADTLSEQLDATVVFTGSEKEIPLIQRITAQMQADACLIAGDTHTGQLAALYDRALVVLGPDSGPIHLAAAVGTPTVALFGPARTSEFAPWGPQNKNIVLTSDIGCLGCGILDWGIDDLANHPCVREISVGRVLEAARRAVNHDPHREIR